MKTIDAASFEFFLKLYMKERCFVLAEKENHKFVVRIEDAHKIGGWADKKYPHKCAKCQILFQPLEPVVQYEHRTKELYHLRHIPESFVINLSQIEYKLIPNSPLVGLEVTPTSP